MPEAAAVLEKMVTSGVDEVDVLLGAETPNGVCFAAQTLRAPAKLSAPKRGMYPVKRGFRSNHVPPTLLVDRYLSGAVKLTKAGVDRADHFWIHGRDQDARQVHLQQARVAALGCGFLGGLLAWLLVQAGIGNVPLVDLDIMAWPNVGRHHLGAGSVDRFKAPALAQQIETAYPHMAKLPGGVSVWGRKRTYE